MTSLVNGERVNHTSVNDRGLLYGQTVFETIVVDQGKALLLEAHLARLNLGAKTLGIPCDMALLRQEIDALSVDLARNIIRVTLTMGEGARGYLNPVAAQSMRIITTHPFPTLRKEHWQQGITLGVADIRLADQPALAGIKHGNRLEQIIARSQWHAEWQEALLLDQHEQVIEATQSNVFIVNDARLLTPRLDKSGVAGVMREFVLNHANKIGVSVEIVSLSLADVLAAEQVFLTNSVIGLWPVKHLNSTRYSSFETAHKLLNLMIENEAIPTF